MSIIDQGWAIRRNDSCLEGVEIDCGDTVDSWHACCPSGSVCPHQFNAACCKPGQNCTQSLVSAPKQRCANGTWDLYNNDGFFCCQHGDTGFNLGETDGCAPPGFQFSDGQNVLSTVSAGSTSTASASPSSLSPSSSSSTPVGAIVGGVVGGVVFLALAAFLAWFLLRQRKQSQADIAPPETRYNPEAAPMMVKYRQDAEQGALVEADATEKAPQELPVQAQFINQKPVELPTATSPT